MTTAPMIIQGGIIAQSRHFLSFFLIMILYTVPACFRILFDRLDTTSGY
jgi:hypothetical protein